MMLPRPVGFVSISKITLADGQELSTQQAVDYGWIKAPAGRQPAGWGLERHEVPVGKNLFLDQGRQAMAFAFGGRSPTVNYAISLFAIGTGTTAAQVTDVALAAPILFPSSLYHKAVDSIDYMSPFVVRVAFTIGTTEANGTLISEMGLLTGGQALVTRKVRATSINKTSDYAPTLTWRIRF